MKLKLAVAAATLLTAFVLFNAVSHSQAGDSPITIGNGSLFINSPGLNGWQKGASALDHPNQNGSVTRVNITQGAATQFNGACASAGGQCTIVVDYGRSSRKGTLRVHSNQNSPSGLHIERAGLADFRNWAQTDANTLTFEPNVHDGISSVTVNGSSFCTGQGDCRVVITYHQP